MAFTSGITRHEVDMKILVFVNLVLVLIEIVEKYNTGYVTCRKGFIIISSSCGGGGGRKGMHDKGHVGAGRKGSRGGAPVCGRCTMCGVTTGNTHDNY